MEGRKSDCKLYLKKERKILMRKRLMAVALAAVMMIGLGGCAEKDKNSDGEIVTLTWLVPGDKQADIESVMEKVNEITVAKIGAKLDMQFIDEAAFKERMNMNMAAGEPYDLCFTGYLNPCVTAVTNEALMPLKDLIDEYAPGLWETVPEYMWSFAEIKGDYYAVPNTQVCSLPSSIVVNKEICDKYNFDFSKMEKMEDLEPFLKIIKENEPNVFPYRSNYGTTMWTYGVYEEISAGVGIRCDGSSTEVLFINETPEDAQGRATIKRWIELGYIRPDVNSVGDDTLDWNAGKYAFGNTGWKPGLEADMKNSLGREYEFIKLYDPYMKYNSGAQTMISIGINSKHPEKAIKFIELINADKDLYNLICFGIKDKHYTLNDEGKVSYIDGSGYGPKAAWKFGNQFNALILADQDIDVWEQTKEMDAKAVRSPIAGFSLDMTPIKTEISKVTAVIAEGPKSQSDDDWEEYIQRLEIAGRQKIKEEIQRQVDEFFKTKK